MKTRTIIVSLLALAVSMSLAACAGFDMGDIVHVKTPNGIQKTQGLPRTISLNEAEDEYQAWFDTVQRDGAAWRNNIERANEIRGILGQLAMTGLDELGPTIMGIPVIGPLAPGLGMLATYFIGAGNVRKQKEKSYNAGIDKGAATATKPPTPGTPPATA